MVIKAHSDRQLCLGCAEVSPIVGGEASACPSCGSTTTSSERKELIFYARAAAEYGYGYRVAYEEALEEEGEIPACALAPAGDALVWMALAALSGIIGGASWELAGAAIRRIMDQVERDGKEADAVSVYQDDEEFRRFALYIEDFAEALRTADPQIRNAVIGEMVMNENIRLRLLEGFDGTSEARRALARTRVKRTLECPLTKEDFEEIWKHIDLSG